MLPQRYVFSSKSQQLCNLILVFLVVIATTKVRIFKQITTFSFHKCYCTKLLLLPQRYVFSSKSQLCPSLYSTRLGCYCYHKGTYFQANHNSKFISGVINPGCYCYHKGTYFQANHNRCGLLQLVRNVVIATTKVRIFKQITTSAAASMSHNLLLLLPQRYVFSSKSQLWSDSSVNAQRCYCYHKGTYFQANHNTKWLTLSLILLLLLPQRYVFSSKSQQFIHALLYALSCCCYHKDMIPGADK